MTRLNGKVALITGGARGMGASHASRFVEHGARVVITDVLEADGHAMAAQLGEACTFLPLDVTSADGWNSVIAEVQSRFRALHILVSNAGVARSALIGDVSDQHYDRIMNINLRSMFYGAQAATPLIRSSGGGSIVNISSISALVAGPGSSVYAASKAAVAGFTRALATELAADKIRVNAVHPGFIETSMLSEVERAPQLLPQIPLGRFGKPSEISDAVVFLASDESSYVTGASLVADGGFTTQ